MSLYSEFETSGSWFFRYRSFLPLVALPLFVTSLQSYTYLGQSHRLTEWWQTFCFLLSLSGLAVRIVTVGYAPHGTAGRNTRRQVAETLNTTGMYSLVRHPLYFGNYLILLGFVMFFRSWSLVLLMTCLYTLYYERIMFAEEAFLKKRFGDLFEYWAASTPAFIPRLHGWIRPTLPFCWRTVLRREYSGLFLITSVFPLLDLLGDWFVEAKVHPDWPWFFVFVLGAMVYVTSRTLKRRTELLRVAGR